MTYCQQCGAEVPAGARFCPSCAAPAAAPPAPAAVPPASATAATTTATAAPAWLAADWVVAVVSAFVLLGICLAVALPYGVLLALAASADAGSILSGLVTGAFLPFIMFGVETVAARADGDTTVILAARFLPLLFLAVPVAATWFALRFALRRVPPSTDPTVRVALVVKIALIVCVVAAVMAGLLSIGDEGDFGGRNFFSNVSVGGAIFYPLLIIVPAGLAYLWRHGIRPWAGQLRRVTDNLWARNAAWGAAAFVAMAAAMGVLALVADIITADDGKDRVSQIVRVPIDGLNEGVAGAVFAMGGAVARLASHTSLLHWGSYDSPGDGSAPVPLFLLLALAPALVGWVTYRRLEQQRPTDEQTVLSIATAIVGGFVVTAWLLSFLGRIERLSVDPIVQPSPRGAFGLGLLWAAVGAAGAAFLWSKRRGVSWKLLQPHSSTTLTADPTSLVVAPPAPAPDPTPVAPATPNALDDPPPVALDDETLVMDQSGAAAARTRTCPQCAAPAPVGTTYCGECGTRIRPTRTRRPLPPE